MGLFGGAENSGGNRPKRDGSRWVGERPVSRKREFGTCPGSASHRSIRGVFCFGSKNT